MELVFLGNIGNSNSQGQRVYSVEGISTTMSAHSGGLEAKTGLYMVYDPYNKTLVKDQTCITTLRTNYSNGNARIIEINRIQTNVLKKVENIYPSGGQNGMIYNNDGIAPTLRSGQGIKGHGIGSNNTPKILMEDYRIRRLTPLECWRLMGFDDDDFWKARNTRLSNTQLYKLAGNSIVVNVLEAIFKELFCMISKYYQK